MIPFQRTDMNSRSNIFGPGFIRNSLQIGAWTCSSSISVRTQRFQRVQCTFNGADCNGFVARIAVAVDIILHVINGNFWMPLLEPFEPIILTIIMLVTRSHSKNGSEDAA